MDPLVKIVISSLKNNKGKICAWWGTTLETTSSVQEWEGQMDIQWDELRMDLMGDFTICITFCLISVYFLAFGPRRADFHFFVSINGRAVWSPDNRNRTKESIFLFSINFKRRGIVVSIKCYEACILCLFQHNFCYSVLHNYYALDLIFVNIYRWICIQIFR